jgi:hypothetical protein
MRSLTVSNNQAAGMPNLAVFFEPERTWIISRDLEEVVGNFCAMRDAGGYGSRDFGKRIVLYRMSANRVEKRAIGQVHYNGNVALAEVL